MSAGTLSDNESYRSEFLRRKNRLAAGEVKGYYRYFDHTAAVDDSGSSNVAPSLKVATNKPVPSNTLWNYDDLRREQITAQNPKGGGGVVEAPSAKMVGYYNVTPCQGSIRDARATAAQTPPKVSFDPSDLTPLDRLPTQLNESTTSLLSSSPFKVSENSAFSPVQRAISVEHLDPNINVPTICSSSSSTIAEPPQLSVVIRNINAKQAQLLTDQTDNNNNNQKQSSDQMVVWPKTTTSTMRDDSAIRLKNDYATFNDNALKYDSGNNNIVDNMAISRFARKELFSPSKIFPKPDYGNRHPLNGPRLLQQANSTIAAANRKEEIQSNMTLPSVMRSAMRYQKFEPTNGVSLPAAQRELPPETDVRPIQKPFYVVGNQKLNDPPQNHQQMSVKKQPVITDQLLETDRKISSVPSSKIDSDTCYDNLSRWQNEQLQYRKLHKQHHFDDQNQTQRQQHVQFQQQQLAQQLQPQFQKQVSTDVLDTILDQSRVEFSANKNRNRNVVVVPEEGVEWKYGNPAGKREHNSNGHDEPSYKISSVKETNHIKAEINGTKENAGESRKHNHQPNKSFVVDHENAIAVDEDVVESLPRSSENATNNSTDDVLASGNVGAKTKLFEILAKHEKDDVDEANAYKTPSHSLRRKTERSRTIHTTLRHPISPVEDEATFDSFVRPIANAPSNVVPSDSTTARASNNATPPSSSEENFEDEKSKLSLSEKAKFFEIKSQESKLRNKRFQQRHKTQPITQQHRSRSRTRKEEVVKARIIAQPTNNSNHRQRSPLDEEEDRSSASRTSTHRVSDENTYRSFSTNRVSDDTVHQQNRSKVVVAVKPRRTVFLHTDNNGSQTVSQKESGEYSINNVVQKSSTVNSFNGDTPSFYSNTEEPINRLVIAITPNDMKTNNRQKIQSKVLHGNKWKSSEMLAFRTDNWLSDGDDYDGVDALLFDTQIQKFSSWHAPKSNRKSFPLFLSESFDSLRESEL